MVVLVIVIVVMPGGRDDLTTTVGSADGADPVRTAGAVALRARVEPGRGDLVLRPALGGAAVRLLFLGDGHAVQKGTSHPATAPGLRARAWKQDPR